MSPDLIVTGFAVLAAIFFAGCLYDPKGKARRAAWAKYRRDVARKDATWSENFKNMGQPE